MQPCQNIIDRLSPPGCLCIFCHYKLAWLRYCYVLCWAILLHPRSMYSHLRIFSSTWTGIGGIPIPSVITTAGGFNGGGSEGLHTNTRHLSDPLPLILTDGLHRVKDLLDPVGNTYTKWIQYQPKRPASVGSFLHESSYSDEQKAHVTFTILLL